MSKKSTYILLVTIFIALSAFIILRYDGKENTVAFFPLQERKGLLAQSAEWASVKTSGESLIRIVREDPDNTKKALELASLYIREARVTGDFAYYDKAAMTYITKVLQKEPGHFQALTLQSLIYLSQHHFAEGLAVAEKAHRQNPYNAFVYGLLVDACVEMGAYDSAVANADRMMAIRPDIRSYARVSYLREIHGDYPGAIDAMKMAVDAGGEGDETTEWTRIQLARLYESTGDLKRAEMHYLIALEERPGYAYALAGLGHLAATAGAYPKALQYYQQADSAVQDYALKEQIGQLYLLMGEKKKGEAIIQKMISDMNAEAGNGKDDGTVGHYSDRELAYAWLLVGNGDKALLHAKAEYERRPLNIDVNETLAWVYYKTGAIQKALPFINAALKTHSVNPVLLNRAGLIYAAAGDKVRAKELLILGTRNQPSIDVSLLQEARAVLKNL